MKDLIQPSKRHFCALVARSGHLWKGLRRFRRLRQLSSFFVSSSLVPYRRNDAVGILGAIPDERTFGVDDLPPHRLEMQFPPEVVTLADKTKFAPEEAHRLETDLRKLLPP